jgi:hypothetical protein
MTCSNKKSFIMDERRGILSSNSICVEDRDGRRLEEKNKFSKHKSILMI